MTRIQRSIRRWIDIFVEDFETPDGTVYQWGDLSNGEYLKVNGNTITSDGGGGGC